MKTIYTLFSACLLTLNVTAQITIDSTDFGHVGDQVLYASDSASTVTVDPATGMAQTFNYSNLVPGFSGFVNFIDPTTTPEGALFQESNIAISVFGNEVFYVDKSDTAMNMVGLFADVLGGGAPIPLKFHPPVSMAKFPMDFNDTYTVTSVVDTTIQDTFTGLFDSIRVKRNVHITTLVDAYGTLNLPGMSEDVLRQYDVETFADTAWGLLLGQWQNVTQQYTENYYYRFTGKNKAYYLLELQTDLTNNVLAVNFQPGSGVVAQISQYNDAFCYGNNDGLAIASAIGGTPPYAYLWSHGAIDSVASSLVAGNYTVTVTDALGDTSSISIFIDQPDSLVFTVDSIGPDYGGQEGYVHISVSGGTPIYLYNWSNGENNQNNSNLAFGDYTLTVTDNNQCTKSETFTVPNLTSVEENEDTGFLMFPNPTNGQVNIKAISPWQIQVYSVSGTLVAQNQGLGNEVLDFSYLKNGNYIVAIESNGKRMQQQLQIVK
jgi:hypothetical protein